MTRKCRSCHEHKTLDHFQLERVRESCRECIRKRNTPYWQRVRSGMCGQCGEAEPLPGRRSCEECLTVKRIKTRLSREAA